MKLSKRLETVASMVTKGNRAADVGCDHGFVPIFLVESGISPLAVAADVRPGPLSRAKEHIKEHRLEEKIQTRLSDGLANIKPGEADSLIMSGIGGILMMRLLQDEEQTAKSFKELILSPQSELFDVRRYLASNGYLIEYEHMLCDEGKYYFIMDCVYHDMAEGAVYNNNTHLQEKNAAEYTEEELRYGRYLIDNHSEVLKEYLDKEYDSFISIQKSLKEQNVKKPSAAIEKRLQELEADIEYNRKAELSCCAQDAQK